MITVNDLGYLRAPEPEDLQWLYGVENDATLWYLGISKEPWSKAVLADYLAAQPGNLQRDGQLRLLFVYNGETRQADFTSLASIPLARRLRADVSKDTRANPVILFIKISNAFIYGPDMFELWKNSAFYSEPKLFYPPLLYFGNAAKIFMTVVNERCLVETRR